MPFLNKPCFVIFIFQLYFCQYEILHFVQQTVLLEVGESQPWLKKQFISRERIAMRSFDQRHLLQLTYLVPSFFCPDLNWKKYKGTQDRLLFYFHHNIDIFYIKWIVMPSIRRGSNFLIFFSVFFFAALYCSCL